MDPERRCLELVYRLAPVILLGLMLGPAVLIQQETPPGKTGPQGN